MARGRERMITEPQGEFSERIIGRFEGERPGPLVISIGGLHGNEPAGVFASRNVLRQLTGLQPRFSGEYLALAGNLPALRRGTRYIDDDLNRIWIKERVARLESPTSEPAGVEESQLRDLLTEIRRGLSRTSGEAYFIDLHTMSAPGAPFVVVADTLLNRHLATALRTPIVLGLEEHLSGTLMNFVNDLGHVAVGFEGGQHDSPSAAVTHELAIWRALRAAGCVDASQGPGADVATRSFRQRFEGRPRVVEVRYRHGVDPADTFVMEPGFENLMRVQRGDLLAHDRSGPIRAVESGLVLMPLYQTLGEDGYFLVRRVWPFWLEVSAWMRRLGLEKLLPLLPGVQRETDARDTLRVNPSVARWFVLEVFHLLGFRRQGSENGMLLFARRVENRRP